jgi:hypothetical protein
MKNSGLIVSFTNLAWPAAAAAGAITRRNFSGTRMSDCQKIFRNVFPMAVSTYNQLANAHEPAAAVCDCFSEELKYS